MELLILNFKQSLQYLKGHKVQTLVVVGIVSVALTALTLSGYILWYQTHKESHLPQYRDIYRVQVANPSGWLPYSYFVNDSITCDIRDRVPGEAKVGTMIYISAGLKGANDTIVKNVTYGVNDGYFDVMRHDFISGKPARKSYEIVLTEPLARLLYGNADAVGKMLEVATVNKDVYTVSGVMRVDDESDFEKRIGALVYHDIVPVEANGYCYAPASAEIFIRTDNPDEVQKTLDGTLQRFSTSEYNNDYTAMKLVPHRLAGLLREYGSFWEAAFYPTVFMLLSSLLLVSALFCYLVLMNMATASRWTDYRLRLCLGGGKKDTMRRISAEAILVFSAIGVVTFMLVVWLFPMYLQDMDIPVSGALLLFACLYAGLLLFVLLMCCVPVALQERNYRNSLTGAPQGKLSPLRYPLIVGQITVSVLLLFLVWQGGRQTAFLCGDALGMDIGNVYRIAKKANTYHAIYTQEIAREIANSSSAIESCVFNHPLFNRNATIQYGVEGFERGVTCIKLSNATMQLFGMQPKLFKPSSEPFEWGGNQVLLSSNAAEFYGVNAENPYIRMPREMEVVGTLDLCTRNLLKEPELMAYLPDMDDDMGSEIYFRIRPGKEKEGVAAVEEVYRKRGFGNLLDNGDIGVEPFGEMIAQSYKTERHYLKFYSMLSVAGICIAVFGLLVLIANDLQSQRRALAVRRIFGAKFKVCFLNMLKTYMAVMLIGSTIALCLGYWLMDMWLSMYKMHISLGWLQAAVIVSVMALVVTLLVFSKVRSCFKEQPSRVIAS